MKSKIAESIKAPKPPDDEVIENLSAIALNDEAIISNFAISAYDLSNQSGQLITIESGRLERVRFNGCSLSKSRLSDLRMETCDLSNVNWTNCKINRVTLTNCKLTGLKLTECRLADVVFDNCVGDLVQMCSSQFKKVYFKNCRLTGIDLRFCDLQEAVFHHCDLQEAVFYDANLGGTDLRGSELLQMKANPKDLKGAIIDVQQSIDLASHLAAVLGMQVKKD
jgi:uncharacterized protein YjbI with pentapeptide repeats